MRAFLQDKDLQRHFGKQTESDERLGTTHFARIYYGNFFNKNTVWPGNIRSARRIRITAWELMIDKLYFLVISKLSV